MLDYTQGLLTQVQKTLDAQWGELFDATIDENKGSSVRIKGLRARQLLNTQCLQYITQHVLTRPARKTLVLGGGYGFPMLANPFPDGHMVVTDLSPKALEIFSRRDYPTPDRSSCCLWDASSIPERYQYDFINRIINTDIRDPDHLLEQFDLYLQKIPSLICWPFEDSEFDIILSPVILESLPFGAISAALEDKMAIIKTGRKDADLSILSSCLGEEFYYRKSLRNAFTSLLSHHFSEVDRCLSAGGVFYLSIWLRADEQKFRHGHGDKDLLRIGDIRLETESWKENISKWKPIFHSETRVFGQERPSVFNQFALLH